ncbi:hypothetical protein [Actinokineospora enzanensis]|uniref:hypothetical protein n=1 Tax=Actinokineospora enzanensis TaxID=155975 RepID=UPI00039B1FD2|nr:hypothetical protein [Actinokineospora enzanensis]
MAPIANLRRLRAAGISEPQAASESRETKALQHHGEAEAFSDRTTPKATGDRRLGAGQENHT